jgi:hypothetical protein
MEIITDDSIISSARRGIWYNHNKERGFASILVNSADEVVMVLANERK